MRPGAIPENCARLAWVHPAPTALLRLTEPTPPTWSEARHDPGLVLLLLRHPVCALETPSAALFDRLLQSPELPELALSHLNENAAPPTAVGQRVRGWCLRCAATAAQLAEQGRRCDPEAAWVAGLLAPLGWLALSEAEPELAEAWLQEREPSFDQAALGRRLARRWRLPAWLTPTIGHLGLSVSISRQLGADAELFETVQQAVALVQREPDHLDLALPPQPVAPLDDSLARLLRLAAENRRLRQWTALEQEVDVLQRALEQRPEACEDRLRVLKLRSLAEFAAGAGHEINNPLAVISGQAQYLLGYETDPARRKPMETIIAQTQRIHRLLRDLMQFARPAPPQRQPMPLGRLLAEAADSLQSLADEKVVRLERLAGVEECRDQVFGDPAQLRSVLSAVLRNAIEAAGDGGWVRLSLDGTDIMVEDSGPGLNASQREHLFDPFYSGRSAGRGAGLGLSLAWALARQHDGDIVLASGPDEPTRFVVRLPLMTAPPTALAG